MKSLTATNFYVFPFPFPQLLHLSPSQTEHTGAECDFFFFFLQEAQLNHNNMFRENLLLHILVLSISVYVTTVAGSVC